MRYVTLTVTTEQKLIVNTQKKVRKESKHNTKGSYQTIRGERNREKLQKQPESNYQNGPKYKPINIFFEWKWTKFPNQKTQSG